jgi:hypothetical protein
MSATIYVVSATLVFVLSGLLAMAGMGAAFLIRAAVLLPGGTFS